MKFLLEIAHIIVVSVTGIVTVIVHGDISTRLIKMQDHMIKTLTKIGLSLTNFSTKTSLNIDNLCKILER